MASTEDDVVVRLRLKDVAKFIADVKSGKLAIDDLEKKIQKAGQTSAREVSSSGGLGKLASHFRFLAGFAKTGALALGAATVGVAGYAVKSAASMEQVSVSMETMLGSAVKARSMMGMLQKFAVDTPFEFGDVAKQAQHLLAFGFAAKTVIPSLTAVGNAASGLGLGAEGMDRVVTALGQIRMKGRVQGDEMLQLAEAGINANAYLEKTLKLTPAQLQKAQQAGKISARTAIPIILKGMDDQFRGLMEKQSHTLSGIWSNLHDSVQQGLVRVASPFLPAMKQWLQALVDRMPQIEAFLTRTLNTGIAKVKVGIEMGRQVVDSIKTAISTGDWGPIGAALGTRLRTALIGGGSAAGGVDWFDIGKKAAGGAISFILGFVEALLDPGTWWPIIQKHWLDIVLIIVSLFPIGKAAGLFGKVLTKLPFLGKLGEWFVRLGAGLEKAGGPLWKFITRIGRAIGSAFIRIWPELGTNLWYWFTRIGEFFTKDVPGLRTKVVKWVADLVPRAVEGMFTAIFKVIERLMKPLRSLAKTIWKPIGDAFGAVVDWITQRWSQFFGWLGGLPVIGGIFGGIADSAQPGAPAPAPSGGGAGMAHRSGVQSRLATGGTVTQSGLTLVGERGPEVLHLGRGSQVIPLPRAPEFVAGSRGPIHVHVMVDKREIARAVYDDMGDRVARR